MSVATGHGYPQVWFPGCGEFCCGLKVRRGPATWPCPGYRLHPLKGERRGLWSVRVSGNWRVVFRFEGMEAVDVDLIDYH